MTLHTDGVHQERVRGIMARKRILKPTGWVVDMRHYLDEETGDLPDAIPERVLPNHDAYVVSSDRVR